MSSSRPPRRSRRRDRPRYHGQLVLVAWLLGAAFASSCILDRGGAIPADVGQGGAGNTGGTGPECTIDTVEEDCSGVDTICRWRICFNGSCGAEDAPEGTGCGDNPGAGIEVCNGSGSCVGNWGQPCNQPGECRDNLCVEGYCCSGPCEGLCESCAVPTHEGVCSPVPAGENEGSECGEGVCDGARLCATGAYRWAKGFGDNHADESWSLAVDSDGNVIIAGWFEHDIDFGGGTVSVGSTHEAFVAKLEPVQGDLLWARTFGNTATVQDQRAYGVAVDSDDNVYVTGVFDTAIAFDLVGPDHLSAGGLDGFVAKFEPVDGDLLWAQTFGGVESDYGWDLAIVGADQVVVTGYFDSPVLGFPNSSVTADNADNVDGGTLNLFLLGLDGSLSPLWAHGFGDDVVDQCNRDYPCAHVAVDGSDSIVLAAGVNGTVNFGAADLTGDGFDVVLAKFDSAGVYQWAQRNIEPDNQAVGDLLITEDDNLLLTGGFFGSIDFGGGALSSLGGADLFVAELDPAGQYVDSWSRGAPGDQWGSGLALDAAGNLLLLGAYEGAFDLGGTPLPSVGTQSVFVAKYAAGGIHLWSHGFGSTSNVQDGEGLAVAPDGAIAFTGWFEGSMDFGDGPVTSAGARDAFVAVIEP